MSSERNFQIFTKPVGDHCNLMCSYCYYQSGNSVESAGKTMLNDNDFLENYIIQHIEATTDDTVFFSWHGGEPTVAGIDFYKKVIQIQKKNLPAGKRLLNGIQTNGTIIDDNWGRFLKEGDFIVGISIDGPKELHNRFRLAKNGQGSFDQVYRGLKLLQKYGVPVEVLCVVNTGNVSHPLKVYRFLRDQSVHFITFLPLVERMGDADVSSKSVKAGDFGNFLIRIFDEWMVHDIGKIQVQIFEETLQTAFHKEHSLCILKKECGGVPVIENTGNFYACDHFVNDKFLLGNISENTISFYLDSEFQRTFGKAKSVKLPKYCLECEVLEMCNGECPKNRFIKTPAGENGLNYLCEGYRRFFKHCIPFIRQIKEIGEKGGV